MKPKLRAAAIFLAAALTLSCTTALAASDETTIASATGATAKFTTTAQDQMTVSYTDNSITSGSNYLLLVVKCSGVDSVVSGNTITGTPTYQISESNILYIDQATASDHAVTFTNVYPSSIQDSVILIAGADGGPIIAAIVDAKYILGDVTGDGVVTSADAIALARHLARLDSLDGSALLAADLDHNGSVTSADIVKLARYLAKIIQVLD
jgi:hypothetical protein